MRTLPFALFFVCLFILTSCQHGKKKTRTTTAISTPAFLSQKTIQNQDLLNLMVEDLKRVYQADSHYFSVVPLTSSLVKQSFVTLGQERSYPESKVERLVQTVQHYLNHRCCFYLFMGEVAGSQNKKKKFYEMLYHTSTQTHMAQFPHQEDRSQPIYKILVKRMKATTNQKETMTYPIHWSHILCGPRLPLDRGFKITFKDRQLNKAQAQLEWIVSPHQFAE